MISLNVLPQPAIDTAALLDWVAAAKPPYLLVMDEIEVGRRVEMTSPRTEIVFRRYRPDDHKLYETISPAQFLDSVADVPAGWIAQCLNEPGGNQAQMVDWLIAVIAEADKRGRRLALPNWSVGNPDTEAVGNGVYDSLWHAMAASGRHVLGLHEYAHTAPLSEPFHVGRYKAILARFDTLKLKRPVVVMTEHGRDTAGGHDGWRSVFSEAQYADFLAEAQTVYAADGICACVFSYGAGFDARWYTYDVQGANTLLDRMAAMNDQPTEGDEMVPGYVKAKTRQAGANVNVRVGPGLKHAAVTTVKTGDWVKRLPGSTISADGYTWAQVAVDKDAASHIHGWVATEVIEVFSFTHTTLPTL